MQTLIINNNSKHLKELRSLFDDATIIDKSDLTNKLEIKKYDLLVFSGGSDIPTVLRHPDEYRLEMNLIKKVMFPLLVSAWESK